MADIAHLEKMGRELKCPICLSLLNSAVSLTCNHVFCNSCIVKSMKSGSTCPVCKVPFQRREVRPAPHMDNLVNIYKSMEVALGISIFTTQTAPSTNMSDGQNQGECKSDIGKQQIGENSHQKPKKERKFKGKSTEHVKTNEKIPGLQLVKPSFPAKKRVQVPQYPLSETPTRPKSLDAGFGKSVEEEALESSVLPNKKLKEASEPILSPFFWVKERNEEDDDMDNFCSQHTEGDVVTDTSQKAPSFSDLKDSDDESPTTMTANGEVHSGPKVDAFDSEMFEWTQRACSPELCSTPVKKQEVNKDELCVIREGSYVTLHACTTSPHGVETISENLRSVSAKKESEHKNADTANSVPPTNKIVEARKEKKKSSKGYKRTNGRSQRKHHKLSLDGDPGDVPNDSSKTENLDKRNRCDGIDNAQSLVGRKLWRGKETSSFDTASEKALDVPTELIDAKRPKIKNQGGENMVAELAVSSDELHKNDKNLILRCKARKGSEIANGHHQKKHPKRARSQKVDDAVARVLNEIHMNANQEYENTHAQLPLSSCLKDNNNEIIDSGEKTGTMAKMREKRGKKRLNDSTDAKSKDGSVDEVLDYYSKNATRKTESIEHLKENLEVNAHKNSEPNDKVLDFTNDGFLRKCEALPNQIRCAFCQSSEDSEASGEMMHYFRGKPVTSDYEGGFNVIHSHKNCAEWAPNVYFEDDTSVNLETELARSRRIRCSCCGLKGAALGCYEKSCRKSFHVPCAKLVPQCRWDNENFVILCPVHASSKLPCEISGPQENCRKRSIPKGESHARKTKLPVKHGLMASQQWKHSGSSNKLVLCCSALAVAEKETVSEFAKLAGLSVAKTWCSSVTHVIASTDENGACRRTLKFLMGVLEGKWILKIDWIKACMEALGPVNEVQYEISVDVHGIRDGPRLGRLRVLNKQPKLFNGFTFYLMGEFTPSYKGYLQDLVIAAGGTVLQRKPISKDKGRLLSESSKSTFVIYSLEQPDKCDLVNKTGICNSRRADAEALANSAGAKVASSSWVLDSIAACKLQSLA